MGGKGGVNMSWLKRILLVVVLLASGMGYFWTQKRPKGQDIPIE
jgi:ABC-type phosphate transport system auxiliary subunit